MDFMNSIQKFEIGLYFLEHSTKLGDLSITKTARVQQFPNSPNPQILHKYTNEARKFCDSFDKYTYIVMR